MRTLAGFSITLYLFLHQNIQISFRVIAHVTIKNENVLVSTIVRIKAIAKAIENITFTLLIKTTYPYIIWLQNKVF